MNVHDYPAAAGNAPAPPEATVDLSVRRWAELQPERPF